VLVSRPTQALYLASGFDVLFHYTAWDWQASAPTIPGVTKVFWYQYRDTGINLDCNAATNATAAAWSPSWNDSYLARYVFPATSTEVVDWWFGMYDGAAIPQPKDAQCVYRLYPDQNAVRTCLTLSHHVFLPTVQTGSIVATSGQ
jgi:hypothetical protein